MFQSDMALCIFILPELARESNPVAHRFPMTKASIDNDKELLSEAQPLTGSRATRAVVQAAVELEVRHLQQEQARRRRTRGIGRTNG